MTSVSAGRVPATEADTSSTHPYTCNTCQVAFRNSELQRGHMRSDWHRYNLKRRVTSLPPITSEFFTDKVLQAQSASNAAATKASYERSCNVCERTYFSENAYINHIGSLKHRTKAAQQTGYQEDEAESVQGSTSLLGQPTAVSESMNSVEESDVTEVAEGIKKANLKENQLPVRPKQPVAASENGDGSVKIAFSVTNEDTPNLKLCLFCNYESPSIELSANHMAKIHEMFIPEKDFLIDLEGLIGSLYEKIHEFHECLYCGKLKQSVFGLQTHMRDVGHCKIPFHTEEEQLEIGEFYDFTSTYSDVEDLLDSEDEEPKQRNGVKLGARRTTKPDGEGDAKMEEGDGWETDSSASSCDSEDLTALPKDGREHQYEKLHEHPHHTHANPRPHHNKDGWHSHAHKHTHAAFYTEYELHLPSGRTAGHRSLNRYYRQNLHSHPSPAERQEVEQLRLENGEGSDEEISDAENSDRRVAQGPLQPSRGRAMVSRGNQHGLVGVSVEKVKEVRKAEARARKTGEREQRKYQWGNNKQANMQKHFRDPLLQ
ncbi:C2H2 type zinc-finger-domain-containing protein [Calycina marina]|uniref:C2H2 type zinc-finger-domain-containing protein n=1 Tax=Calycina marina TaxID=1763456 RepID=A0A9P7Z845_9HELO|nr:C2H2 type zinc-finger-domain-containing protein [Calycina marina]